MPISYTNRKGITYTLYRGETKTGKPRFYFGRTGQGQGDRFLASTELSVDCEVREESDVQPLVS
jgi:hypothetical protein